MRKVKSKTQREARQEGQSAREVARILEKPRHGDCVEYWWVQMDLNPPRVGHFRLTYHEHTTWEEYRKQDGRQKSVHGADYEHEWSLEEEGKEGWGANGRTDTDWIWRRLRDDQVFIEQERAVACLRGLMEERLVRQQEEMAVTKNLLNEL